MSAEMNIFSLSLLDQPPTNHLIAIIIIVDRVAVRSISYHFCFLF